MKFVSRAPRKLSRSAAGLKLLRAAERQEILRALDRILQAAQELLEIGAALDEVDLRSVDHQQVGSGVAEEKMFVGSRDFLDVLEGDVRLVARCFFGDARAQHFRL